MHPRQRPPARNPAISAGARCVIVDPIDLRERPAAAAAVASPAADRRLSAIEQARPSRKRPTAASA